MKKVIDGKVYDTDTATEIHEWDNGYSSDNFHWCSETLYRTSKGAFFLYGEGGAMSPYSRRVGDNSFGGGRNIQVLTDEEAIEWLGEHDGSDKILELFPTKVTEA